MKNRAYHSIWIGTFAAMLAAGSLSSPLFAQSQDSSSTSVAEAARKAREQKKNAVKSSRVITEDTLTLPAASADTTAAPAAPVAPASSSGVADMNVRTEPESPELPKGVSAEMVAATPRKKKPAPAPAPAAAPVPVPDTAAQTAAEEKSTAAQNEAQSAKAAQAKELLAQMQSDLDYLKRQLSLDQDALLSKTDYIRDEDGKAKIAELEKLISDKQLSVEEFKKQVADLLKLQGAAPAAETPANPPKP